MTVLLVHGAWQGSWAWERLTPLLLEAGLDVQLLDLPGNGSDDTDPADVSLELYVAAVERCLSSIKGRVSIVAHSGAGIVASQVAEACPERIASLIYIAGMMLPDGLSFAEVVASVLDDDPSAAGIGPHLVWSEDRLTSCVPIEAARRIFFQDCSDDLAEAAARRLTPQPERGRAVRPRLSPERFGRIPRLYIETVNDRSGVLTVQRRMQALVPGAKAASLPTGHAPQLAAPKKLADCIIPWLRLSETRNRIAAS
jgi:pimeloyl-ACP methyl ester carboxylesterase